MLVEIETGVKLRLLRQKFLEAAIMLERPAQLGAVIGQGLLLPLDFMVFLFGFMIKHTQNILDTRNRPQRIFGVEIGLVRILASDE